MDRTSDVEFIRDFASTQQYRKPNRLPPRPYHGYRFKGEPPLVSFSGDVAGAATVIRHAIAASARTRLKEKTALVLNKQGFETFMQDEALHDLIVLSTNKTVIAQGILGVTANNGMEVYVDAAQPHVAALYAFGMWHRIIKTARRHGMVQ